MATYRQFEDLPVYQDAIRLSLWVFRLNEQREFRGRGDLKNQLSRAALSVSNNVAEGFERGSNRELISFIGYAKGSAGEVRSMCNVIQADRQTEEIKQAAGKIYELSTSIGKQLQRWSAHLRDGEMRGDRFYGKRDRERAAQRKREDVFWKKIEKMTEEAAKKRKEDRKKGGQDSRSKMQGDEGDADELIQDS